MTRTFWLSMVAAAVLIAASGVYAWAGKICVGCGPS